ncbi:MAG: methyltransferase domain-containing protein [Actinomycetota bacterium]|nr:methyltransferase domain-containing protein [Actinomycetota bacterium]
MAESSRVQWDPQIYERFDRERTQPFFDLISRVSAASPARVVDLGCGTGSTTAILAQRWPDAEVLGIDSSTEMLEKATSMPDLPANLHFEQMDIAAWMPTPGVDVVVTNAAMQWIPESVELMPHWFAAMDEGAWFAMQVPHSAQLPWHVLLNRLVRSDRWREQLGDEIRAGGQVAALADYLELMLASGLEAQAWETEYLHVLSGAEPVLDWVRGTTLRPVIAKLGTEDSEIFEQQYSALLREAYPRSAHGTNYPFKRIFAVGQKR